MNTYARLGAVVAIVVVVVVATAVTLRPSTTNVANSASPSLLAASSAGPRSRVPSPSAAVPSPSAAVPSSAPGLLAFEHFGGQLDLTPAHPEASWNRLWVVRTDGTDVHELFPTRKGNQAQMAWSPDGKQLVFWDQPAPGHERLIESDPSGSSPRVLDTGCRRPVCAEDDSPAFSRDGRQLVLVRVLQDPKHSSMPAGSELVVWDVATGKTRVLGSTKVSFAGGEAWDSAPRWSPDGRRIVFYRWHFRANEQRTGSDVYVVDADGRNLRRLTPDGFDAGDPDWSPDGKRIVFNSDPAHLYLEGSTPARGADIYTIGPDGSDLQKLTDDGYSYSPTWLADGRILFMRGPLLSGFVSSDFWMMNGDGTNTVKVTNFDGHEGSCCSFYAAMQPTP